MRVVGLDWAVCPSDRAAVVLEKREDNPISVAHVISPVDNDAAKALCKCEANHVVAVDIPFAWPREFGDFVSRWRPCCVDQCNPPQNTRFRYRTTDHFVHEKTGKWPLSVSTNLFALGALEWASIVHSSKLGSQILVNTNREPDIKLPAIIEVYPGATLKSFENDKLPNVSGTSTRITEDAVPAIEKSYSYKTDEQTRRALVTAIIAAFDINADKPTIGRIVSWGKKDHATDGLLAAITAMIYSGAIRGWTTYQPNDEQIADAKNEGWIFFPKKIGNT